MRLIGSLSDNISDVTFAISERFHAANSRRLSGFGRFYLAALSGLAQILILGQLANPRASYLVAASGVAALDLIFLGTGAFVWLVVVCLWAAFRK